MGFMDRFYGSNQMIVCAAGQLEHEMRENMWIHLPATTDILFKTNINDLWGKSFARLGLNPATLSSTAGTA